MEKQFRPCCNNKSKKMTFTFFKRTKYEILTQKKKNKTSSNVRKIHFFTLYDYLIFLSTGTIRKRPTKFIQSFQKKKKQQNQTSKFPY